MRTFYFARVQTGCCKKLNFCEDFKEEYCAKAHACVILILFKNWFISKNTWNFSIIKTTFVSPQSSSALRLTDAPLPWALPTLLKFALGYPGHCLLDIIPFCSNSNRGIHERGRKCHSIELNAWIRLEKQLSLNKAPLSGLFHSNMILFLPWSWEVLRFDKLFWVRMWIPRVEFLESTLKFL